MRTFERTHAWIKFSVDLRSAPPSLWLFLGECQSKCEHIAGVPLQPATAEELHKLYLAKGVQATTAIEGNTLSEAEVLELLEGKLELPPSREYLAQEVDNIISACNAIRDEIVEGKLPSLSAARFKDLNRRVLDKLVVEEGVVPGQVRKYQVGVARYRGAPPEDCEYLLERLCEWLNSTEFEPVKGQELAFATIKAVLAHLYLAWIHPFGDGNGRTARLVEFQLLLSSGVPAPASHLLSNHYNQTRAEYYRQLDQASKSGGDVVPFLLYSIRGFVDGLRAQLGVIRNQQWAVAWRDYIHEIFGSRAGSTQQRRGALLLDLGMKSHATPLSELSKLSPRVASFYARLSEKTLLRDIKALLAEDLVRVEAGRIRANRDIILAFLPIRTMS